MVAGLEPAEGGRMIGEGVVDDKLVMFGIVDGEMMVYRWIEVCRWRIA